MVDTFQILLAIVILTLTVVLALVGVQVFLILREVQRSFQKINEVLDGMKKAADNASESLTGFLGVLGGFKTIFPILSLFRKKKRKKGEEDE
jgi:hypothetical protein